MKRNRFGFGVLTGLVLSAAAFALPALRSAAPGSQGRNYLAAVAATGESATVEPNVNRQEIGYAQVEITGTATVTMDIKVHSDAPWVTAYTFTSSGIAQCPRCAQMRFNVTSYTSGAVSAWYSQ